MKRLTLILFSVVALLIAALSQEPPEFLLFNNRTSATVISDAAFYNTAGLSKFRSALSGVSTDIVEILVIGDSITQGGYSTVDWFTNGFVGVLSTGLKSLYGDAGVGLIPGWRTQFHGFTNFCMWYYPTNANGTLDGTWSFVRFIPEYGGPFNRICKTTGSSGGRKVSMSPITCSFFDVMYLEYPSSSSGTNTLHVDVDGSTVTNFTIGTSGTPTFKAQRVNTAVSAGQVELFPASTGTLIFLGFKFYNATNGIMVHNFGWSAQSLTNMVGCKDGAYANFNTNENQITNLTAFSVGVQPDLTMIAMTVNDYRYQFGLEGYSNSAWVASSQLTNYGSLLWIGCGERNPASFTWTNSQTNFHLVISNAAVANNTGYYDFIRRWGNFANATNVLGYMADSVHPNQSGHTDMANALSNAILNVNQTP